MGFICIEYFIFLLFAVFLYFKSPAAVRAYILLACSYFFYAFYGISNLLILLASTFFTFYISHFIYRSGNATARTAYYALALAIDIGALTAFKYSDLIMKLISPAGWEQAGVTTSFLLPVGISFYTFQSLSYTIDVYRRRREPEKNLGYYALYVSFFPQLVSGPIARSGYMLKQFYDTTTFSFENFKSGALIILWGLFKKVVVADRIAELLGLYYKTPPEYSLFINLIIAFLFVFQVYFDFSGYTDIAIGSARLFNIQLMANFSKPFTATSLRELWTRWHITLYNWFRDYIYIPLGGNQLPFLKWSGTVLLIYALMGIWHGNGWNYFMFGVIHGLLVITEVLVCVKLFKLNLVNTRIGNIVTVTLFALGSVVFMFNSVEDYFSFWKGFMHFSLKNALSVETAYTGVFILIAFLLERRQDTTELAPFAGINSPVLRALLLDLLLFLVILSSNKANTNFFYHQF